MKLLFAGKTDFTYNRDQILINGLHQLDGIDVTTYTMKDRSSKTRKQITHLSQEHDFVVVPTFRHREIGLVASASKVPVIFDPLISRYMTRILDYQKTWKAPHKLFVDWLAFNRPDALIWDTQAHSDFIKKKFRISKPMAPIYIGVDEKLFFPIPKDETKSHKTIVGFYGSFNPLQGIDKIVKAANILSYRKDIEFQIIGNGSTYKQVRDLASHLDSKNITWIDKVPFEALNDAINKFDICLGIFGDSLKADVVIPNKIYHYSGAGKAIITKDTAAIKEIFTNEKDIYLTQNTPRSIADAIIHLVDSPKTCLQLGSAANQLITTNFNKKEIAKSFVNFLAQL